MLAVYAVCCPSCLSAETVIQQFLPNVYANNWYITCYIVFLFIYPLLDHILAAVDQRQLLRIALGSSLMWIVGNYIINGMFFWSVILLWCTIYFIMAYIKLYCGRCVDSDKTAAVLIAVGAIGYVAQVLVPNFIALKNEDPYADVLYWNNVSSPFCLMLAIGLFFAAQRSKLRSGAINHISSLSLLVYLFHENVLFRTYTRPAIWQWLYTTFGYSHVVLLDLAYAFVLFLASIAVCAVYKETLHRAVSWIADKLFAPLSKAYVHLEDKLVK